VSEQTGLMTINDVVTVIRDRLSAVWDSNADEAGLVPTEIQEALALVWANVQMLQAANEQNERLLESTLATADELRMQRDVAAREAKWHKGKREEAVIRDLAQYIGHDAQVPPQDVARVLGILVGLEDLPVSQFTLKDFYAALQELAAEAFAEDEFRKAADTEYAAEIAADQAAKGGS
jgi:hypothetical protein